MKHPYREETRTPEEIRLSKNAYKKRKMLAKKKRVKSEKLKRKKQKRLRLKEAKDLENISETIVAANGGADETAKAESERTADNHQKSAGGGGLGKGVVLDDAAQDGTSEGAGKIKKKSKRRKRTEAEAIAESKSSEDNMDTDGKQDPVYAGIKTSSAGKLDRKKRRKSQQPDKASKEGDDGPEGSEECEGSPTDQEGVVCTENDDGSKSAAELPTQPDLSVEVRKKKTVGKKRGDANGQNDRLGNAKDDDGNGNWAKGKKAGGTNDASDSGSDTVADNGEELNSNETKADKMDTTGDRSVVRKKDGEKKGKKDVRLKKKKSKRKGKL